MHIAPKRVVGTEVSGFALEEFMSEEVAQTAGGPDVWPKPIPEPDPKPPEPDPTPEPSPVPPVPEPAPAFSGTLFPYGA
jgi:hypothetical protein